MPRMSKHPDVTRFKRSIIPADPSPKDLALAAADLQTMNIAVIRLLVERMERRPDSPWIDMRMSLITGEDFPANDPLRGPGAVSGWIQGRGIEAMVGHARWLRSLGVESDLVDRLTKSSRRLLDAICKARQNNGGHVYFFMSPDGAPLDWDGKTMKPKTLTAESPYNFSDLFTAKGLYAAACYLNDKSAMDEAHRYCMDVNKAVSEGRFVTDQQQLDPKNIVRPVPGRHSHGTWMIHIATAAVLLEGLRNSETVEFGLEQVRFILRHHVNLENRFPQLQPYDFFEFRDDTGQPYTRDGKVHSDCGHALEFVGFTLKFTRLVRRLNVATPAQLGEIDRIESLVPAIAERNFTNGFNTNAGGITKAFDLIGREPINSDMPWWSLPETIRTAAGLASVARDEASMRKALAMFSACHNAFIGGFVKPELRLQAVQTRNAAGETIDVIAATPDADPGYHTGLSLIDALNVLREDIGVTSV